MKILVISDSHGNVGTILTAIDREKPDVLIHLGDGLKDLADIKFAGQIYGVRGNCDLKAKVGTKGKLEHNKQIILYLHGHEFDVHDNYEKLIDFAKIQGADIVLFGHTHKADYFTRDGIVFLNPGAINNRTDGTYATIIFENGKKTKFEHHKIS